MSSIRYGIFNDISFVLFCEANGLMFMLLFGVICICMLICCALSECFRSFILLFLKGFKMMI